MPTILNTHITKDYNSHKRKLQTWNSNTDFGFYNFKVHHNLRLNKLWKYTAKYWDKDLAMSDII